jgi:hypothetical protein
LPVAEEKKITLNRESNEHTRRLKRSLNKVKWSSALMQIFWTAGPVTTIGLIGGYYIGYGTMPSTELLIYFVMFTVFSGLVGLVAKVVKDGTRGHLEERSKRDILSVTDKLGDLILIARDKIVETYEEDARTREAALQLLRRVDLTPYGVSVAFTDLTGNRKVGEIMGQIHAYRRIGLQTRVRDLYSEHKDLIYETIEKLEISSPYAAGELKRWFTGNTAGKLKYGVPREKQFLQRVMAAIENNNPYLMTFRDVEEMMILAFELINGREIPTLTFSYSGKWKYAKALDQLEKKRSKFRVTQARVGNRMRALSAYLVETGFADADELPDGLEINKLIERISKILDHISLQTSRKVKINKMSPGEIERTAGIMDTCIELYRMAHEGSKDSVKQHKELLKASDEWSKLKTKIEKTTTGIKIESGRKGIHINENVISLSEEAVLEVCRHLSWYFKKEDIKNRSYSLFSSFNNRGAMAARRLAIEIAVALEPHIGLSKPEIQRNINATKAIYLGGISPDMSALQKQELGEKMAKEVDNGLSTAAIRLVETLVYQYQVDLSDHAVEFFNYNYHAPRKSLERLAKKGGRNVSNSNPLNELPPVVPAPKSAWQKSLQSIKKKASALK